MCRPSTSITRRSLGLNAWIHLSMISFRILFHSSTMDSLKKSRSVILLSRYTFYSSRSQILFGGQWWSNRSCYLSFKISRVILAALALSCSVPPYASSACSFQESLSSIVHYNNTSHLPLYLVQQKNWNFDSFPHRNHYLLGKGFNFVE